MSFQCPLMLGGRFYGEMEEIMANIQACKEAEAMNEFPNRLQKLRKEKRPLLSMAATSELIGPPTGAIRKYERGEAKPTAETLAAIADYFNVSMDYLWGRTNY